MLIDRFGLESVGGLQCYSVEVSGLLHDGIDKKCEHDFQSTLAWEDFLDANGEWISKPELKYHGTSEVDGFSSSGGIFSGCRRPKARVETVGTIAICNALRQLYSTHGLSRLKLLDGSFISAVFSKFNAIAGLGVATPRNGATRARHAGATRCVDCFSFHVHLAGT